MRLNFAGMPEDQIREGVRRIGSAMRAQLALFGSLTGRRGAPAPPAATTAPPAALPQTAPSQEDRQAGDAGLADVVKLPRREQHPERRSQHE